MADTTRFKALIERLVRDNGWTASELHDEEAVIDYELEGGALYSLNFILQDDVVEISLPSEAVFENEEDIPHEASTMLLRRNMFTDAGFWGLDEYDGQLCYTLIHVELLESLEESDSAELDDLITVLVEECDEVNSIWEDTDF
jgi:hypothetical protein